MWIKLNIKKRADFGASMNREGGNQKKVSTCSGTPWFFCHQEFPDWFCTLWEEKKEEERRQIGIKIKEEKLDLGKEKEEEKNY